MDQPPFHATDDLPWSDPSLGNAQACTPPLSPVIGGRAIVRLAEALSSEHGDDAACAAVLRAAQSRARDNPYSYCQWREVARVLAWMSAPVPVTQRQ